MAACDHLGTNVFYNTYRDYWNNLCRYNTPDISYDQFLTGVSMTYASSNAKFQLFSDYQTRLLNSCFSGGSSTGSGTFVTGGTANGTNDTLVFTNSTGGTFTVDNSALLFNDAFVSGGTLNSGTGCVTFKNTSGGTFDVCGFDGFTSYWSANTNGSISNSGLTLTKIGVGTDSPTHKLHVKGNSTSDDPVKLETVQAGRGYVLVIDDDGVVYKSKSTSGGISASTIYVTGDVKASGEISAATLDISGNVDIDGTTNLDVVDIDGAVDMSSTLTLTGNADFNGDLDVDGTTNLDVVDIDGAVDMASTLTVAGNVDFNGDLDVDGTLNVDELDIDGNVQLDGTLTVGVNDTGYDVKFFGATAGQYMLWDESVDTLFVTGEIDAGSLDISGNIDVDGISNLDVVDIDGAVDMATTLTVAGNVDFNGDLDVDGVTNLDAVDIDGAVDMATTLTVTGNVDFNGDLDVDGTTNLDVVDIDGAVDMASTLSIGNIPAAGGGYTGDKILVSDGGAVEFLTISQLREDIGDADYWSGSTDQANAIVNSGMTLTNVGIGTTTPLKPLTVKGDISGSTAIYLGNHTNFISGETSTTGDLTIHSGDDIELYAGDDIVLNTDCRVKFTYLTGTTEPHSTPGIEFSLDDSPGNCLIQNGQENTVIAVTSADTRLYFNDIGGEYIVGDGTDLTIASGVDILLTPTGKVGIGTIVPNEKLTVVGNMSASTSIFAPIISGTTAMIEGNLGVTGNTNISANLDVDGITNLDVVDIDGAVDMATTLTVAGVTTLNSYKGTGSVTVTDIKDTDNFSDASATSLATSESIKAYVDASVPSESDTLQTVTERGATSNQAITLTNTFTVGVDDTGHDVKFFGATSGQYMLWDQSTDKLIVTGEIEATKFDGALEGNADTATILATARNIGGVSFNGSANIDLPGVNTAGNQNTSGLAATATILATARNIGGVSFNGSANINLPGVNTSGNQDTSGNAATATKIASITNSDIVQLTDSQTLTNKTLTSPVLNTAISGSAFLDEDDMASDSATKVASQQSIKAYVLAQVGTADTLQEVTDNGATTDNVITVAGLTTSGNITLNGDSDKIILGAGGDGEIYVDTDNLIISNTTSDKDILFNGLDNGSDITALTLDMSSGGMATFSNSIVATFDLKIGDNRYIGSASDPDAIRIAANGLVTFTAGLAGELTGNASTATILATARNIGGVSFNGSSNINLPGVNTAGNQNTSGNAATATLAADATTLATARTIGGVSFDGSANIDLPGVNTTGNQDTSGNAATSTKIASITNADIVVLGGAQTLTGTKTLNSFKGTGSVTVTNILDEDNMASDSATALVTQQSVKAYVDASVPSENDTLQTVTVRGATSNQAITLSNTFTVGVDDTGHDVKFFGATSGQYMLWDESADKLIVTGEIEATKFDGALEGNADTATILATARNIGGVSFNGSANIDLPGVNTAGNQNTSGLAATATILATARNIGGVSFNGSANIDLPGVNTAGNQNTSGTAAVATTVTVTDESSDTTCFPVFAQSATGNVAIETGSNLTFNSSSGLLKAVSFEGDLTGDVTGNLDGTASSASVLATARTIGGVSFNGSANIDLPGVNTAGNQNTSGLAATATILATARNIGGVSFNGSANIDLPGVNTSGNQDTSGNADTATKIASITNANIVQLAGAQTLTGTKTLNSFKGTGSVTVTNILDEDNMASNSATALATQQSIKAYVDGATGESDTLQTVTSRGATSDVAITLSNDLTVGSNGTGFDVKFFGDTSGQYMLWDQSADKLIVTGEIEATKFDGALEGNADTATILANARTIGGVSFNGSANIDLPGVNSAGNQNTSGLAATATILATARNIGGVSFNGSANIDLPGVNSSGNQNTSGNAATATILATARTIGGVSFNGSANINLPGVNTAGNQNTSGLAATATILATARNIGGVSFNGSANIDLPGVNATGNQDTSGNAATSTKIASITNNNIVQLAGAQTLTGTKTLNSFKGTGSVTVTNILDEDNMASNSATALVTQQSVKAYVDASIPSESDTLQTVTERGATSNQAITLSNTFTVGVDDTGHDVKFFGDDSGEYMFWDTSSARLEIKHTDESVGLEVYTNAAATTTQPQLKVGRSSSQYWGVYTDDRNAHLVHRQDETSGTMTTRFDQWDSNTSDTTGEWLWRFGNGSGGSMATSMTLTQAGLLTVSNVTGDLTGDVTGNADTATILATTRTIGGVSFNGSANINLPGVNTAGNQDTSGVAATATILATARNIGGVSFNGSANINLPGVNTAGNQNTSGNAATATILATARTIGGVSFNGSANIDLPGVNSDGNQDTSGNAATATLAADATTLATARNIGGVSFDGSANIDLPGVNTSGNQDTSGNAATSTKIASITNANIVQLAGAQTLTGTKTLNSFKGTGSVTVTNILDEDNMASNSATALATQQSIKAYVDSASGESDTLQDVTSRGATSNVAITLSNNFTVGVNGTGHDVKFFGDTSGQYMLWDQSADKLIVTGEIEATKFDGALEGNADTATILATARTIGGVSFNGSANIDLPGVNTAGNQNTSGLAATATILATARNIGGVSFNGSANIDLPGVNTAGNQNTSGTAAEATILENARTIGGVSFNGSANIDLPGVNSAGNQNTSGTAAIATTVTLADESSDTTCFPIFSKAQTGDRPMKTGSNLTFNSSSGLLKASSFEGDLTGDVTGNLDGTASSAAVLATARNIGGVSFNGSANIDLPGVNTAGNQNTSGNAATATILATARTIGGVSFNGSANIDLPGVNSSGNQDTSGNAATSTKIASITNNNIVQLAGAQTLTGTKTLNSFKGTGAVTVTNILDEDNMASDSATALATQQSIKAYIDSASGESDTLQDVTSRGATSNVAITLSNDFTVGVNGTGHDVKFFGDTSGQYMLWDQSADKLIVTGEIEATKFDGALEGNADTATILATARNIGGVSFNGSANIDLPGVNTAGNQNTSGLAATATILATARNIGGVSFNGSANIDLPGVNTSGNQDTSGNAATATKIASITNGDIVLLSTTTTQTGTKTFSGVVDITNTTDASDATGDTGALRTEGGASIAKKLYVGTDLDVGGKVITAEIEASDTILLDATNDITIDAGGGDIILSDDGTIFGTLSSSSGLQIRSRVNNADMFLRGVDGGVEFTALRLDMSAAGTATFSSDVLVSTGVVKISSDGANWTTFTESGSGTMTIATVDDFIVDATGDIILDAADNDILFKDAGTHIGTVNLSSQNLNIISSVSDKDIIFKGNDGGGTITALTLDISEAGKAIFNAGATFAGEVAMGTNKITGMGDPTSDQDAATKAYVDTQVGGSDSLQEVTDVGSTTTNSISTAGLTSSGIVDITNTTDSSDATGDTGALRTEGGASIAKKLYVGSTITGDLTGDVTGNADTATVLATARNIGGVSFNGGANIDLPGVNTAGNQNTSGLAATATILATARTIGGVSFNGSANIDLPGVNSAGNQNTSGLAATATILATARNIGGVSFNGSANIDLPGVNATGNQDTSGTAAVATTSTNVTLADESSDTTCFPVFSKAQTGDRPMKTGSNLTFNSSSGLLTATLLAGDLTGDVTGNADTATVLATARNIGGVSFNGSANIDLPGVNTAGNQNTSGLAATATILATARNIGGVSFNGSANIDLPGVNSAGNQNTSGLAATATILATARNIGGVSFNGSANIDLPGVNTAGNQNTSGTAAVATVATNVTAVATTDNTEFFVGVLDGASGSQVVETSTKLKQNPSTGKLTVTGALQLDGGSSGSSPVPRIKLNNYVDNNAPSTSHIDLYGAQYGFGVTSADLDYLTGRNHKFYLHNASSASLTINTDTTYTGVVGIQTETPKTALDVHHNPTNLATNTGGGEVVTFGSNTSGMVAGKLYYMNTSGAWALTHADANSTDGNGQLLGIALGASASAGVLLRGFFDMASYLTGGFNEGIPLYVCETTSGNINVAAPGATNEFVRVVGYLTNTANVIYFNPDGTYITVA